MRYIIISFFVTCLALTSTHSVAGEQVTQIPEPNGMMGVGWGWSGERTPGTAALLSLQPMPVDLGNFYVEDWGKGILYTSLELGLFIPGVMLMGNHDWGHSHRRDNDSWTSSERTTFYSLLAGFIAVKVISAYDAASTAEKMRNTERFSFEFDFSSRTSMILTHFSF